MTALPQIAELRHGRDAAWPLAAALALLAWGVALALRLGLDLVIGDQAPFLTYFPAVIALGVMAGWRAAGLAAVLALVTVAWQATDGGNAAPTPGRIVSLVGFAVVVSTLLLLIAAYRTSRREALEGQAALEEAAEELEAMRTAREVGAFAYDGGGRLFWYPSLRRLFGLDESLTPDLNAVLRRVSPADRSRVRETLKAGVQGPLDRIELEVGLLGRRDEPARHLLIRGVREVDAEGRARLVGSCTDLTPWHGQAARRQDALWQLDLLTSSGEVGTWVLDSAREEVTLSGGLAALYGLEAGRAHPTALYARAAGLDPDQLQSGVWDALVGEQTLALEHTVETASGPRHLISRGMPFLELDGSSRVVGVTLDVTELKRAQKIAEHARARYLTLLEATSTIVWTASGDGRIVEPQPAWAAVTGMDESQYMGEGWTEAVHPDDRERLFGLWMQAVADRSVYEAECRFWFGKRKEWRWTHSRAAPLLGPDGDILEWVGTLTDIHDQKTGKKAAARRPRVTAD